MTPTQCDRCGAPHAADRCQAHSKSTGLQCGNAPIRGASTCRMHGSSTPAARAKAAANVAREEAAKALAGFGVLRPVDPAHALLEEVWRSAALVAMYEGIVAALDHADLVWGVVKRKDGGDDRGTTWQAAPNVWLSLLNEERDRLAARCVAALKAGLEERQVQLAEREGELIAVVINGILGDLRLSEAQQQLARTVVPRHLRAIDGGA